MPGSLLRTHHLRQTGCIAASSLPSGIAILTGSSLTVLIVSALASVVTTLLLCVAAVLPDLVAQLQRARIVSRVLAQTETLDDAVKLLTALGSGSTPADRT